MGRGHGAPGPADGRPTAPEPERGPAAGSVHPLPQLRTATAADAAAIVRLLATVALEGMLGLEPATLRVEDEAERLARLDLRQACALVVTVRGHVQACGIAVRGAGAAIAHTATVSVAVAPESRRRGFGRLLLLGLRAWAEAAGVRKLCAGVCDRNEGALALFHGCGYAVEGVRREQVLAGGGPADEVLFGLALPRPAAQDGPRAAAPAEGCGDPAAAARVIPLRAQDRAPASPGRRAGRRRKGRRGRRSR